MKQEREKSLLYTPFQEINKVDSPPFQGIIGSKDSKKLLLCPDYLIKAGQVSIFQNSFAVQYTFSPQICGANGIFSPQNNGIL